MVPPGKKRRKYCKRRFRWFGRRRKCKRTENFQSSINTLKDVAKGEQAQIVGFTPAVTAEQKSHLLAYGLVPGYSVRIIQQNPVTVVQVEHLELALEHNLSGEIQVKSTTS